MPGDSSAATTDRRNHSLYRMRDISGRLLYVGRSNNGLRRFMEHSKDKTWWREVATIDVEHVFCSLEVISALEMETIKAERPLYNVTGNVTPQPAPSAALPRPLAPAPIDPLTGRAALGGRARAPEYQPFDRAVTFPCSVTKSSGDKCRNGCSPGSKNCAPHAHVAEGYVYLPADVIEAEGGQVFQPIIRLIGDRYAALDDDTRGRVHQIVQRVRINPETGGHPTKRRAALVLAVILASQSPAFDAFASNIGKQIEHFGLDDAQSALRSWMETAGETENRFNELLVNRVAT
jgi:hypothetical protein